MEKLNKLRVATKIIKHFYNLNHGKIVSIAWFIRRYSYIIFNGKMDCQCYPEATLKYLKCIIYIMMESLLSVMHWYSQAIVLNNWC